MNAEANRFGSPGHREGLSRIDGNGIVKNESELRPIQPELDGARRLEDRILCPHTIYIDAVGAIRVEDLVPISIRVDLKVTERNSGIILDENVILRAAANTRDGVANRISSPREAA